MKFVYPYSALSALSVAGFPFVAGLSEAVPVSSTTLSISMRAFVVVVSLFILFLAVNGNVRIIRGTFWFLIIAFWLAYLTRIYVDSIGSKVLSREPIEYWSWSVGVCFLPMLALLTVPKHSYIGQTYKVIFWLFFFAGCFVALYGSSAYLDRNAVLVEIGRMNIKALNPISVGHLGLSLFVVAFWPVLRTGRLADIRRAPMRVAASGLGIFLLLAAASRGPVASFVLLASIYFAVRIWKVPRLLVVLMLLTLTVGTSVAYLESSSNFSVVTRMEGAISGQDAGVLGRKEAYLGAINAFLQNPVFGSSLEEPATQFYPHNVVLESLMATGLVGGVPFVLIVIYVCWISVRMIRIAPDHGWVYLLYIQYFIAAQFSGSLYTSGTFWACLAMSIAFYKSTLAEVSYHEGQNGLLFREN